MTDSRISPALPPDVILPTIALLGAGSLGSAILSGLITPRVEVSGGIRVTTRTSAASDQLPHHSGLTVNSTQVDPGANISAVTDARIVVVAVKPAMVPDLLREIAPALGSDAIVVSVAAGVTLATMEALLPESVRVIRSMPNTPALVGKAVTGISAGSGVTPSELRLVRSLFETVGEVVEVPETQIDALSTISGSGPAYVFALIEALTLAAEGKGFDRGTARTLVEQTFLGAALLLASSEETPAELRRRVTSPGGTTERALEVMARADLPSMFEEATDAALARASELARAATDLRP